MARLIVTFILIAGLIVAATFEQIFINNIYGKLGQDLETLSATMEVQTDVNTPANIAKIGAMYKYWSKKEKTLAFFARHTELSFISDALIYIKNFTEFNDKKEAFAGIQRLRYLIDPHSFNVGTSIQNVI